MSHDKKKWTADTDGAAIASELHRSMGVSHRQAKGLIDARCVTVNGEPVKTHGQRLKTGDEVEVNFDPGTTYHEYPRPSKGTDADVRVLWEDKHLVFVDKPAGLLSVPTEHSDDESLADALVEHYRQKGIKKPRVFIVHRLDRFTTGVMVFAKTPEALNALKDTFAEHNLNRIYKAILVGELPENSGTLHDKVAERTRRLKMIVVASRAGAPRPKDAKPAVTHYRVIDRLPGHTVVELKLETGRRNQIRVQFSERGFPVLGDKIYGSSSPLMERQALHAEILGLEHPVTKESLTVQSEMPSDMQAALHKLRMLRRVDRAKEGLKGEAGIFKPRAPKDSWEGRDASEWEGSKEGRRGASAGSRVRKGPRAGEAKDGRGESNRPRREGYPRHKDRIGDGGERRERREPRDGAPGDFKPETKRHYKTDGERPHGKPSRYERGVGEDRARPARPHSDGLRKEGYPRRSDRDDRGGGKGRDGAASKGPRDAGASRGPKTERRFSSPNAQSDKRRTERRNAPSGPRPPRKPK